MGSAGCWDLRQEGAGGAGRNPVSGIHKLQPVLEPVVGGGAGVETDDCSLQMS